MMRSITKKGWLKSLAIIAILLISIIVIPSCSKSPTADNSQQVDVAEPPTAQPIAPTPTDFPTIAEGENTGKEPNRLINEKSPYLLQHAYNPVDWYPWGEEAFAKAREENKPIFLSIGYSTCHWCHVMAEESFSDPEVAELINDAFVSIMVDREERPDIDNYFTNAAAILSGNSGWPLNVIMTPDQDPFFASTYIPRETRFGRVGLLELIPQVQLAWLQQDQDLLNAADRVNQLLDQAMSTSAAGELALDDALLAKTFQELSDEYDSQNGGFGEAPKFPTPHRLLFLLRYWQRTGDPAALNMVEATLQAMRHGAVYDQVGLGFHRYTTDAAWQVPHFEKMLYDQGLLALAYTEAYQATGNPEYEQVAREIFSYVLRDMTSPEGGFYSAEDADSEGEEGKFYLWTAVEIRQTLSAEEADLIIAAFNITEDGNFANPETGELTGTNVLYQMQPLPELAIALGMSEEELGTRLESARQQLFAAREARIHPHKDDKVLADWNGLMIAALAKGGQVFDDDEYTTAAQNAAVFILQNMRDENGRLLHRYRDGEAAVQAHIDDVAFLIWGLLELYEATFDIHYLESAINLSDTAVTHYWDVEEGGFYFTPDDGEDVIARQKLIYDGVIPSGNSVMMLNLVRLGRLTADPAYDEQATAVADAFAGYIAAQPSAYTQIMSGIDFGMGPSFEIVIVGEANAADTQAMLTALRAEYVPNKVVLLIPPETSPEITELADYTKYYYSQDGQATAYVCQNFYCESPTTDVAKMIAFLHKNEIQP